MAAKHWLVGCGIGCGAILLIVGALVVGGGLFVRDAVEGFSAAVESRATLEERFGRVPDFTPWPDGAVPAERMEAFLAVREANAPAREKIVEAFSALPMSEEQARELESKPLTEKMRSVVGIVGSAFGLAGHLGDFYEARNRELLVHEIGLGEYTHIYAVAYYAWLDHSPEDTPENTSVDMRSGEVRINHDGAHAEIGDHKAQRVRADLLRQLRNQLAALPEGQDDAWRATLAEEIARIERDDGRVPWQDGVPPQIVASLAPYADRLEASYDPRTNPFELLQNRRQGKLSIQAE